MQAIMTIRLILEMKVQVAAFFSTQPHSQVLSPIRLSLPPSHSVGLGEENPWNKDETYQI